MTEEKPAVQTMNLQFIVGLLTVIMAVGSMTVFFTTSLNDVSTKLLLVEQSLNNVVTVMTDLSENGLTKTEMQSWVEIFKAKNSDLTVPDIR